MNKEHTTTRGMQKQPRLTATAPLQEAAKPDPLTGRYWNASTFEEQKFFDETFSLQGGANEGLHRDLDGHLFIKGYEFNERGTKVTRVHLRAVSYAEACDWLVRNGQRRPPQKFLAFHGIRGPAAVQPAAATTKSEWVRVSVELPDRDTLNRINALAKAVGGSATRIAGAAIRKGLKDPFFDEILLAHEQMKVAGLPGLPEKIMGPAMYPKVQDLSLKGRMLASELILAVLWTQLEMDDESQAVFRSEEVFLPIARKIVKLANGAREHVETAQREPSEKPHKLPTPETQNQKGGRR